MDFHKSGYYTIKIVKYYISNIIFANFGRFCIVFEITNYRFY